MYTLLLSAPIVDSSLHIVDHSTSYITSAHPYADLFLLLFSSYLITTPSLFIFFFFFLIIRHPPNSPLFPSTPLFRSSGPAPRRPGRGVGRDPAAAQDRPVDPGGFDRVLNRLVLPAE